MLVLDDESVITEALQAYFEAHGFAVDAAADRDEAMALLKAHDFRVVIADLRLTGTTCEEGLEVIRASRSSSPGAAVILLTAHHSREIERRALEAGADILLQKPKPLVEIDRVVRSLLKRALTVGETAMQTPKKILLVDDSATVLLMEKMILSKCSYQLITANDGDEALSKAVAERPDLILLDVIMPKMTGFEALRAIRHVEATRNTPVIMVTTRGEADNVENGFESGCSEYVTKPINAVELLTKVRNCLGE
jgi:DNA-binding response OmpR family regulator